MRHFDFSGDRSAYLRRNTPTLPDDMRRLIDEAVASGRITRVPQGVTGLPRYRFVGEDVAGAGGFMEVHTDAEGREVLMPIGTAKDKAKAKSPRKPSMVGITASNKAKAERAAARRALVRDMFNAGQTAEQIAEAQGTTVAAIKELLKLIRREQRAQGLLPAYVPTGKPEALA